MDKTTDDSPYSIAVYSIRSNDKTRWHWYVYESNLFLVNEGDSCTESQAWLEAASAIVSELQTKQK